VDLPEGEVGRMTLLTDDNDDDHRCCRRLEAKKKKLVKKIKERSRTYGVVIDDVRHSNFILVPPSYSEKKSHPGSHLRARGWPWLHCCR
jgi:hypothetical protein